MQRFEVHLYWTSLSEALRYCCCVVWRIVIGVGDMVLVQAGSFGGRETFLVIGLNSSYCIMILIGAISILNISIEVVLEKSYRPGFSEQLHALLAEMRASSRREIALERWSTGSFARSKIAGQFQFMPSRLEKQLKTLETRII
jgi:hypothetical protein